jgi:alpha-mannosidase
MPKIAKTIVHMIGQAHLDPVWLWRWAEGRAEALGTSQSAVDRLAEYPDFHFTRGESQIYSWIEQENGAMFGEIKRLIAAGRWHVVNGMVIQPDMNLPSGESLVRQVLLGKRTMRRHLGVEPTVAYCVDSFGHAGTLPQILAGCGFDAYVFMRPGPHEKALPANVFWWQGPDGSRILTFRITDAYTTWSADQEAHILAAVAAKPPELDSTMCFFGVGNHGGGPTKAQIENIQALAERYRTGAALDIRFSHPDAFFAAIRSQAAALPAVADELQFHAVGCYSVNSALKAAHRLAENRLLLAEKLAVMADLWAGKPAPRADLDQLWWNLAFNQFHDTLGGSSIKAAEDDAIAELTGLAATADVLANDAARAVAARIDTRGPGATVVAFNPSAQAADVYLEYEPWTGWQDWDDERWGLVDENGAPVTYQNIDPQEALSEPDGRIRRLLFRVALPGLGYRVFRFAPGLPRAGAVDAGVRAAADEQGATLENDRLALRLDGATGNIVSCIDKGTGLELVGPSGWNVGEVIEDRSDTWSHGVRGYGAATGAFGNARIRVGDSGPLRASLLVERSYGASTWQQQVLLCADERAVTVRNWLTWLEPWHLVKLACDVNTAAPVATHDVPFGALARPCDGQEFPTHMWLDVSGPCVARPPSLAQTETLWAAPRTVPPAAAPTAGLALLNDGKYGCDVTGSTARLTILRCVPYAYHDPHPFGTRQHYDWVDLGSQQFTFVLRPHVGGWRACDVVPSARLLNQPPLLVTMHAHEGDLPRIAELASLDNPAVELTACKPADDGDGWIVRLVEGHGRGGPAVLTWQGQAIPLQLGAWEVVTLRLHQTGDAWQAQQCDMLERVKG